MAKHKTRAEWIEWFKKYELQVIDWELYFETLSLKKYSYARQRFFRNDRYKKNQAKRRFIHKYKLWKIGDNLFMNNKNKTRGRKRKNKKRSPEEIEEVVSNLTDHELKEIAKRYLEIVEDKNKKAESGFLKINNSRKAYIFGLHRTTFYKISKQKIYKFDYLKDKIFSIFYEHKKVYGSTRIAAVLTKEGIKISDRTLRNYMNRWNLESITRKKRKRCETKDTSVEFEDLVKRNFNPKQDNIISTDVSYIPANVEQNFIYLSVAISHKTKLIESYKLGFNHNTQLVCDTLKVLKIRDDMIVHSDHGVQYSSTNARALSKKHGYKISMGRIGNSLDNRESEYFFGNLKSECLNHLPTYNYSFDQIKTIIDEYICWYNTKRIQSRLQWKTPTEVSAYAV